MTMSVYDYVVGLAHIGLSSTATPVTSFWWFYFKFWISFKYFCNVSIVDLEYAFSWFESNSAEKYLINFNNRNNSIKTVGTFVLYLL